MTWLRPPSDCRCPVALAALFAFGLGACGGVDVPTHNGYKSAKAKPWAKPSVLELDDEAEAEVDSDVSYVAQRRARWFAVDIPGDGELTVNLNLSVFSDDGRSDVDLAFEVVDERNFQVLVRADGEEDDAGDIKKSRTLYELRQGRYLIHVYAQKRLDKAEFSLRVKYRRGDVARESNFPDEVAFVGDLPIVPPPGVDDTPVAAKKPCGSKCRPSKPRDKPEPQATGISGRITSAVASGGSTKIRFNRGSSQGVTQGARGRVVNSGGKSIVDGSFTVSKVSATESEAVVKASPDAVRAAARVVISP